MHLYHNYLDELPELCTQVSPFPVSQPKVVLQNLSLAKTLGIDASALESEALLSRLFSNGGDKNAAFKSLAQKYGGHQFGHWNPQLGDGRGLLLGEVKTPEGNFIDLHLKGAGPTPYSRHADGRAVLRSTIREYIASEALHALSIPSSRSLCLIASSEPVMREQLEPGAMMIRTAPSHIRFGHFEYFYHNNEHDKLEALFAFCFKYHFADCAAQDKPHKSMLQTIVHSTARLIAKWQAYGFNHGVMNTDNMSIHGITFDYGPYAFLDDFIPNYICNRSDHSGRYAFDQQPGIGLWNLNALAHAFTPFLDIDTLKEVLAEFEPIFLRAYQNLMHQRLGFFALQNENTQACVHEFTQILKDEFADYHLAFRHLSMYLPHILHNHGSNYTQFFKQSERMDNWCKMYTASHLVQKEMINNDASIRSNLQDLLDIEGLQSKMLNVNPLYVLRNHHLQNAIKNAENGDFSVCESLLSAVCSPFEENPSLDAFAHPPSEAEKGIALSCSS